MQRYVRDNHLVWSTEKSTVLRRGGEDGISLDVGDGVAWLERAEEAVVLGPVQAMEAGGVRLPDKLLRGFRAMLVVLQHHALSVQTTLYYLRAVLNAAIGYQGMHLPYLREQLEEVEGEVRGLIRGYGEIPTEVPWCVMQSPAVYYGEGVPTAGEAYRADTARTLSRMYHNQEKVVRRVCYHAVAEVQKEENMFPRYMWHRQRRLAARKRERMWRVLQAVLPVGGAHVGDQQAVQQAGTDPGSGHGLWRGGTWDRTVGQEGRSEYRGAARAQEGYEGIQEGGPAPRGVSSRRQDVRMGFIQVDDEESARTGRPRYVGQEDAKDVERVGGTVGAPEEETKAREGSGSAAGEGGAGQRREGQGVTAA